MGNALSPCYRSNSMSSSAVKIIFWEGNTKILTRKLIAGELMSQHPDSMVCHADSFYIGHPIPALSIDDELLSGQTYFVLPIDRFACNVLSTATLCSLASSPKPAPVIFGETPFEYIKGSNGRTLIKVLPELIIRLISKSNGDQGSSSPSKNFLCSTPELKKHYDQLVGSKDHTWSPRLETISERKKRLSPCHAFGFEWRSSRDLEG